MNSNIIIVFECLQIHTVKLLKGFYRNNLWDLYRLKPF